MNNITSIADKHDIEIYQVRFDDIMFEPYVQMKCQNCVNFGCTYHCPPSTPRYYDSRRIMSKYKYHYIAIMRKDMTEFMSNLLEKYPDYGTIRTVNLSSKNWDVTSYWLFHRAMNEIKKNIRKYVTRNVLVLGSGGGCRLCRTCALKSNEPCKKPDKSLPSPESWGLDVYGTFQNIGLYIETPPRKIYTRVGIIASDKEIEHSKYKTSIYKRPNIDLQSSLSDIGISIIKEESLSSYDIDIKCDKCDTSSFLCDRSFLPIEYLDNFVNNSKIFYLDIPTRGHTKKLSKANDIFHRAGHYDVLSFADHICDLCDKCSESGCKVTNEKRNTKHGNKDAFRCIHYIGISPNNVDINGKIGYIVCRRD